MDVRVLTIGAADQDIFLSGKVLTAKRDVRTQSYVEQFPLGAKLELDNIQFETGGGAHNAAVTFARQGFKTGFMGKIGHDPAGAEVIRVLKKEGIAVDQVAYDTKFHTAYSTILLAPNGERTVLVYRGASHNLKASDFAIKHLQSDWFYISSLAGNLDLLGRLIRHAEANGIKVAFNPGQAEIKQGRKLRKIIPKLEVLLTNREELRQLVGGDEPTETMTQSFGLCPYVVMTDGPSGLYVSDSQRIYFAGQYQKVKVIDRTGAGDAFGSGFVSGLARGGSLEEAVTMGSANSTSVVTQIGAKAGILRTGRIKKMKLKALSI
jgi:sugar/nucleoside kinase (ribokinase family)